MSVLFSALGEGTIYGNERMGPVDLGTITNCSNYAGNGNNMEIKEGTYGSGESNKDTKILFTHANPAHVPKTKTTSKDSLSHIFFAVFYRFNYNSFGKSIQPYTDISYRSDRLGLLLSLFYRNLTGHLSPPACNNNATCEGKWTTYRFWLITNKSSMQTSCNHLKMLFKK